MTTKRSTAFPEVLGGLLVSTMLAGCSLVLDTSVVQCRSDKDCQGGATQGPSLICREQVCLVKDSSRTDAGANPDADASTRDGETPPKGPSLPFAVDDAFFTSGYMGDGERQLITEHACPAGSRGGDGRGRCHKFVYTTGPTSMGWGGLYWQYPANNWDKSPGYVIPTGAKSVAFYAWASAAAPTVTFSIGIQQTDGFEVRSAEIRPGATPRRFVIDLGDIRYEDVVGGFSFSTVAPTAGSLELFLDDIVWSDQPALVDTTFAVDTRGAPLASGCGVRLRGSFDAWGAGVPMKDDDKDGVYEASIELAPNRDVRYRFAQVCDGGVVDEELGAGAPCAPVRDGGGPARVVQVPHESSQVNLACLAACGECPA